MMFHRLMYYILCTYFCRNILCYLVLLIPFASVVWRRVEGSRSSKSSAARGRPGPASEPRGRFRPKRVSLCSRRLSSDEYGDELVVSAV